MDKRNCEQDWCEFWRSLVTKPDGSIDLEQIKKELSDYKILLDNVPIVYSHITGGILSYPTYDAKTVIQCTEEYYNESIVGIIKDDFLEFISDGNVTKEELIEFIKNYFR